MAEVYRAYHANLDRYVAIKVLHAFLADDPEFKTRFEREAQNIARLKHPNIVQVYDFEYDPESESYYMVMELVDGPTLKDYLILMTDKGALLALDESLRIIKQAANALAYAHSRSMIHRDVKPANLMMDHDERVVLTDFGIAKIVTGVQFTASGGMVGTPAYMAPEQGLGEQGDERSDLYSLGVILYQLVTGDLPYDAETPLAIILKHLNSPIPLPSEKNPALPAGIDQILLKAMAKEPQDRYQNAAEFVADLERIERGEPLDIVLPLSARGGSSGSDEDTVRLVTEGDSAQELEARKLDTGKRVQTETPARRRLMSVWAWGGLLIVIVVVGYLAGAAAGFIPIIGAEPTATRTQTVVVTETLVSQALSPSPIVIASATQAPIATLTATPTFTDTATLTSTPSNTPTGTRTPTPTETRTRMPTSTNTPSRTPRPTNTQTATLTPSPTFTLTATKTPTQAATDTPTVDITRTLVSATEQARILTETVEACTFDYAIVSQDPENGAFYPANSDYDRKIIFLNTGDCPWEPNTSLTYLEGENFQVLRGRVFITGQVEVGASYELHFIGRTPGRGGLRTGTWELRTPGQRPIGEPMEISIQVYE